MKPENVKCFYIVQWLPECFKNCVPSEKVYYKYVKKISESTVDFKQIKLQ